MTLPPLSSFLFFFPLSSLSHCHTPRLFASSLFSASAFLSSFSLFFTPPVFFSPYTHPIAHRCPSTPPPPPGTKVRQRTISSPSNCQPNAHLAICTCSIFPPLPVSHSSKTSRSVLPDPRSISSPDDAFCAARPFPVLPARFPIPQMETLRSGTHHFALSPR